jgi:hypothetical protein
MTIPAGHRFEATQALRQVLARALSWGLIDSNSAKQGVDNPQRRRTEKRPFESWAELEALATELGPRYGPLVLFGRERPIRLLDLFTGAEPDVHAVDAVWTLNEPTVADPENGTAV